MTTTTESKRKPGRLTDSKWWFCEIGQHDSCAAEIELVSRFEGCPCECHQTATTQPAPESGGEWRIVNPDGVVVRIVAGENDTIATVFGDTRAERQEKAAQIIRDHNSVPLLVIALEDVIDLWARGQKIINGQPRNVEFDSQVIAARAALATVGREEERDNE